MKTETAWDLPTGFYTVSVDKPGNGCSNSRCRTWCKADQEGGVEIVCTELADTKKEKLNEAWCLPSGCYIVSTANRKDSVAKISQRIWGRATQGGEIEIVAIEVIEPQKIQQAAGGRRSGKVSFSQIAAAICRARGKK